MCTTSLATFSSAINPLIYAARIRRFRVELKRILCLPIKLSDKCETYEIRRTFRIKRPSTLRHTSSTLSEIREETEGDSERAVYGSSENVELSHSSSYTAVSSIATSSDNQPAVPAKDSQRYETVDGESPVKQSNIPTENITADRSHYQLNPGKGCGSKDSSQIKAQARKSISSPITPSTKWVSRGKITKASTMYNTSRPSIKKANAYSIHSDSLRFDDKQEYIAVTVTRIVRDVSDSEEEINMERLEVTGAPPTSDQVTQLLSGRVANGVECVEHLPSEEQNVGNGKRVNILSDQRRLNAHKKRALFRKQLDKRLPLNNSSKTDIGSPDQKLPSQLSLGRQQSTDDSTLEEILRNRQVARNFTRHSNQLLVQLEADQINFEVKSSRQEKARSSFARHYSHNRRRFASTTRQRTHREKELNRAKSFGQLTHSSVTHI